MTETAIVIENLGKRYLIGHEVRHDTLRDRLAAEVRGWWRSTPDTRAPRAFVPFWALRDVSFTVPRGEVLGIIGRNGAGKSTLLKILSRITAPSTGRVRLYGRVASLLEVGTGFHPELTGRENVFLNGGLLGMSHADIRKKFDEIVAFAEVAPFLDTPVKRYSSGMSLRLAFAVAAHLEPEILLVDEVLAVGDAEFQKRCLGKMNEVARASGRTVLFVSHNTVAVQALCHRVALLEGGCLAGVGPSEEMLARYCVPAAARRASRLDQIAHREGDGSVRFTEVALLGDGMPRTGAPLRLLLRFAPRRLGARVKHVGISLWSAMDERLISLSTEFTGRAPGELVDHVVCTVPSLPLVRGTYWLNAHLDSGSGLADYVVHALALEVEDSDYYGTGRGPEPAWGRIVTPCEWTVRPEPSEILT